MLYLVVLSFDATGGQTAAVDEKLSQYGFRKTIQSDEKTAVELPANTYAGTAGGDSANQVATAVREKVREIFNACGVKGSYFVSVGSDWCWASAKV